MTKKIDKFIVGQVVTGKVVETTSFGAFVEIESGVKGLVTIPEFSWTKKIRHGRDMLRNGFNRDFRVIGIDYESKKISLSIKQLVSDPWQELNDQFSVGTDCIAKIQQKTEYGLFVKLAGTDFVGLIHVSQFHESVCLGDFEPQQMIAAQVLTIDIEQRQINLKMLNPNAIESCDDETFN